MSAVWIPESFRDRPYAAAHFARIVQWAQQHHPFYRRFHTDITRPLPVITRPFGRWPADRRWAEDRVEV